jgi:hypothetical protein
MPLIRDLIHIPEQIHRDDFVLRLAEGVTRPAETLRTYVDPRRDHALTLTDGELTDVERNARAATTPDDVELEP